MSLVCQASNENPFAADSMLMLGIFKKDSSQLNLAYLELIPDYLAVNTNRDYSVEISFAAINMDMSYKIVRGLPDRKPMVFGFIFGNQTQELYKRTGIVFNESAGTEFALLGNGSMLQKYESTRHYNDIKDNLLRVEKTGGFFDLYLNGYYEGSVPVSGPTDNSLTIHAMGYNSLQLFIKKLIVKGFPIN